MTPPIAPPRATHPPTHPLTHPHLLFPVGSDDWYDSCEAFVAVTTALSGTGHQCKQVGPGYSLSLCIKLSNCVEDLPLGDFRGSLCRGSAAGQLASAWSKTLVPVTSWTFRISWLKLFSDGACCGACLFSRQSSVAETLPSLIRCCVAA